MKNTTPVNLRYFYPDGRHHSSNYYISQHTDFQTIAEEVYVKLIAWDLPGLQDTVKEPHRMTVLIDIPSKFMHVVQFKP